MADTVFKKNVRSSFEPIFVDEIKPQQIPKIGIVKN